MVCAAIVDPRFRAATSAKIHSTCRACRACASTSCGITPAGARCHIARTCARPAHGCGG